jgi:hypothetical protein
MSSVWTSGQHRLGNRIRLRLGAVLGAVALVAAALLVTAGPAAAASCNQGSCNGKNPYSTGCNTGSEVIHDAELAYSDGVGITTYEGHVRLHYSPTCRTAWASIYGIQTTRSSSDAYSKIVRNDGGAYTCHVPSGGTSCYTDMINDAGFLSHAVGSDYAYSYPDGYYATFYASTGSY